LSVVEQSGGHGRKILSSWPAATAQRQSKAKVARATARRGGAIAVVGNGQRRRSLPPYFFIFVFVSVSSWCSKLIKCWCQVGLDLSRTSHGWPKGQQVRSWGLLMNSWELPTTVLPCWMGSTTTTTAPRRCGTFRTAWHNSEIFLLQKNDSSETFFYDGKRLWSYSAVWTDGDKSQECGRFQHLMVFCSDHRRTQLTENIKKYDTWQKISKRSRLIS
jgi:hypothetical protein